MVTEVNNRTCRNLSRYSWDEKAAMMDKLLDKCDVDFESGRILWRNCHQRWRNGSDIGMMGRNGYRCIRLEGSKGRWAVNIHRVLWYAYTGEQPDCVDHIDRDPLNNRIENLRGCSQSDNSVNKSGAESAKWGVVGVLWTGVSWNASIKAGGKSSNLGYFFRFSDAVRARLSAEMELHGEFGVNRDLSDEELLSMEVEHAKQIDGYWSRVEPSRCEHQSGIKGVTWRDGRWRYRFMVKGERYEVSGFDSVKEAEAAMLEHKRKLNA